MLEEANAYWFADAGQNPTTLTLNSIQDTSFTAVAPSGTSSHMVEEITTGTAGEPTTTKAGWEALLSHADLNNSRFFIDNMYFVAGQNSSNGYAKNAGEVVAGSRVSYAQQTWSNTIPSPATALLP